MKIRVFILFMAGILLLLNLGSILKADEDYRIGIAEFETQGIVPGSFAKILTDITTVEISKYKNTRVVTIGKDRTVVLNELEVHQTGIVGDRYRIDAGLFQGANKILRGKVSRLSNAYYLALHVIDVKTGVYEISRKVTLCSQQEAETKVRLLVKAVMKGLEGTYLDIDSDEKGCGSDLQSETERRFREINETGDIRELTVNYVQASSVLKEPGYNHNPWVMLDSVAETAWADGRTGKDAIGEWLKFYFPGKVSINEIGIINGLGVTGGRWGNLYIKNSSVKSAEIRYSNGKRETINLNRTASVQRVPLKLADDVEWLILTITQEFPGTKYKDTCVSEIKFYGKTK